MSEDAELNAIADARRDGPFVAVTLDDMSDERALDALIEAMETK